MNGQDFKRYLEQLDDPEKMERANNWKAGIGLQAVDNLKVSEFLLDIAYQNIEGMITMSEATKMIDDHYDNKKK